MRIADTPRRWDGTFPKRPAPCDRWSQRGLFPASQRSEAPRRRPVPPGAPVGSQLGNGRRRQTWLSGLAVGPGGRDPGMRKDPARAGLAALSLQDQNPDACGRATPARIALRILSSVLGSRHNRRTRLPDGSGEGGNWVGRHVGAGSGSRRNVPFRLAPAARSNWLARAQDGSPKPFTRSWQGQDALAANSDPSLDGDAR